MVFPIKTLALHGKITAVETLIPTSTVGLHNVSQSTQQGFGATYTNSVFVRASGYNFFQMAGTTDFSTTSWANFDLSTGTVASTGSTGIATIVEITTGLFRCSLSLDSTAETPGEVLMTALPSDLASNMPSFAGDDVSGVCVWGGQMEAKPFMTSYMPTTTATASRGTDTLEILPTNIPLSDEPFSVSAFVDILGINTLSSANEQPVFWVNDETTRQMRTQSVAARNYAPDFVNNGNHAVAPGPLPLRTTTRMVATSNPAGNLELHIDDDQYIGEYKGGATGTATAISIGHTTGGFNGYMYGHIRSFRIDSVVLTHGQIDLL